MADAGLPPRTASRRRTLEVDASEPVTAGRFGAGRYGWMNKVVPVSGLSTPCHPTGTPGSVQ
jgi:hypothetical protein